MRRLFALMLVVALWFNFAPTANADIYSHLTPCSESPAYQARAKNFVNTTSDPQSGAKRAAMYSEALCGPEGLPRLIVDGRFSHMGDFLIPGLMFLYSAGWIGWAGRSYLIAIRKEKNPALKEVSIDVPLAVSKMIGAVAWPLAAFGEFTSGKLVVKDVPVSPR